MPQDSGCVSGFANTSTIPGSPSHEYLVSPTSSRTEAGTVRRRIATACNECRAQKAKCSGHRPRCERCGPRGLRCVYGTDRRRHTRLPMEDVREANASPVSPASTLERPVTAKRVTADTGTWRSNTTPSTTVETTRTPGVVVVSPETPPAEHATARPSAWSDEPSLPLEPWVRQEQRFLRRDVLAQHVEAYFAHVYPQPGYDFLHRPSVLEALHHDRMPPVLATAVCAAASTYVSRSRAGKQLAVEWAQRVDAHLLVHLNDLTLLNLQVLMLSMFQHFAYRQFGRVWLMLGMAARLALSLRLNQDAEPDTEEERIADGDGSNGTSSASEDNDVAARECRRRLAWSVFVHDKLHAGGIDEFVTLPEAWMRTPLPASEADFHDKREGRVGTLSNGLPAVARHGLDLSGYMVLLTNLRYNILR